MNTRFIRAAAALTLGLSMIGAGVAVAADSGPGAISKHVLFDNGSADLKSSIATRISEAVAEVPAGTKFVHLSVVTSAPVGVLESAPKLWVKRINAVTASLKSALVAKGIPVSVETTIWHQPGLKTSNPKLLRVVFFDLNW
jgi:hypothetical protein